MAVSYELIQRVNGLSRHGEDWCLSRCLLAHSSRYAHDSRLAPGGCNGQCPPGKLLEEITLRVPTMNDSWFVQEWMHSVYAWNFGLRQNKIATSTDIGEAWRDHLFGESYSYICGMEFVERKGKPFDFLNPNLDLRKLYDAVESLAIKRQITKLEKEQKPVWPVLRRMGISPKAIFRLPTRVLEEKYPQACVASN